MPDWLNWALMAFAIVASVGASVATVRLTSRAEQRRGAQTSDKRAEVADAE